VLSPGADINDYLLELAKNKGKLASGGLKIISLGQGQGPIAERCVSQKESRNLSLRVASDPQ
jgi:dynein heavy chain